MIPERTEGRTETVRLMKSKGNTLGHKEKCKVLADSLSHVDIGPEAFHRSDGSFVRHLKESEKSSPPTSTWRDYGHEETRILSGLESVEFLKRMQWVDWTYHVRENTPDAYMPGVTYYRFDIPENEEVAAFQCCLRLGVLALDALHDPSVLEGLRIELSGHDKKNARLQIVGPDVPPRPVSFGFVIVAPWQDSEPVVWTWHPGNLMPSGSLSEACVKLGR